MSQFLSDSQLEFQDKPKHYLTLGLSDCAIAFEHAILMVLNDDSTRLEHIDLMTHVALHFEWSCIHAENGYLTKEEVKHHATYLMDILWGLPKSFRA